MSMVNNGYKNSETLSHSHILPGIEELWNYTESNNTMYISDYSLSSLEIDLFDDMRASVKLCIQFGKFKLQISKSTNMHTKFPL